MLKTEAYDIIGDVHGRADALHKLLTMLGYQRRGLSWFHSEDRRLILLGDLIDVGPQQRETLQTVRALIDSGIGRSIMGNHEFNAICYATPDGVGDYLRAHREPSGEHNRQQHEAFLKEFDPSSTEYRESIRWMLGLPLWIETENFRIVHACWNQRAVERLSSMLEDKRIPAFQLAPASRETTSMGADIATLLKGPEGLLPANLTFTDRSGHSRDHVRLAWWRTTARTYGEAALLPSGIALPASDEVLSPELLSDYFESKPTFFGHYCLLDAPIRIGRRTACLDTCAARKHQLTAYRWEGEMDLVDEHFVHVAVSD